MGNRTTHQVTPRILFFGNNNAGLQTLRWLKDQGETIAGIVLHPPSRRRCGDEMIAASGLADSCILAADTLGDPATVEKIAALHPDIGVSVYFGYILPSPLLRVFPRGSVNLHPAYLPFNRGAYPNVWSIVDRTPAGVSLHYIDPGIDTGDIIAQEEVEVLATDTGETLYRRLETAALDLFRKTWPAIKEGSAPRRPQTGNAGSIHRVGDVESIDCIDLDKTYTARDLINILRARTFPPYKGAYFMHDGKKIYISLHLARGDD